jgi:uncharacterized protein YuzB (UPF0349 family)
MESSVKELSKLDKDKCIGTIMTWDNVVELFPDCWAVFKNPEMDYDDIVKGEVVRIMTDEEAEDDIHKYIKPNLVFRRTTEGNIGGYINGRIVKKK